MSQGKQWQLYRAFGLYIACEFPLPELLRGAAASGGEPDVCIEEGDLSHAWEAAGVGPEEPFIIMEQFVMFRIPELADFCILDGKYVIVAPAEGADRDKLRLYVLGTCLGMILLQRKILPLHGSAVAIGGCAYAIVGDSGAGKSTLASVLLRQGYSLLSDDVIAVDVSDGERPIVMPAYPQQKLWQESLEQLEIDSADKRPLFERMTKFSIPLSAGFREEPLPLAGVIELSKSQQERVEIEPVRGFDRLSLYLRHTYRGFALKEMGLAEWHFRVSTRLLAQVDTYRIRRPADRFTAHQLAQTVLASIREEQAVNREAVESP